MFSRIVEKIEWPVQHLIKNIRCYGSISAFIILLCLILPVNGQPASENEYRLKAAFLYNFAKFVEWPGEKSPVNPGTFIVGILGDNPFGRELDIIRGKKIDDAVIDIRQYETIDEITDCNILFISSSENKNLASLTRELQKHKILTVGDTPGYAQEGIMINLYEADNKLRFEINNNAAESAGLKISSNLLRLGKIIGQN